MSWFLALAGIDLTQAPVQAALLSFFGVVLTGSIAIFTWWRNLEKDRQDRQDLRNERRRDLLLALWSDIQPVWIEIYTQGTLRQKQAGVEDAFALARTNGEEKTYTPFVTRVAGTLFDDRLAREVDILEPDEIKPVVLFYHQIRTLNEMATEMRSDRYAALSLIRKKKALHDLFLAEHKAADHAYDALLVLENVLKLADARGARPTIVLKGRIDAARRQ